MSETELIEALAAETHAAWARWTAYLLSKGERDWVIGSPRDVALDADYVAALQRQIDTPYADLTEQEKQADRDEVAHILPLIRAYCRAARSSSYHPQVRNPYGMIAYRAPRAEYDAAQQAAEEEGVSFSAFIRAAVAARREQNEP